MGYRHGARDDFDFFDYFMFKVMDVIVTVVTFIMVWQMFSPYLMKMPAFLVAKAFGVPLGGGGGQGWMWGRRGE